MSNFECEFCGRTQYDSERGYVAGCSHYPPERYLQNRFVNVWFGGKEEKPSLAFYDGSAWYLAEGSKKDGKAVHPVAWQSLVDQPTMSTSR